MEPRRPSLEEQAEARQRELASRWFSETQVPLLMREGTFPDWYQGCISRKDAEDQLRDKPLGCFLMRRSDRAIGYILSYRGSDRCRHFVINQNKAGQLVVSGDTETHGSLTDLIAFYKTNPIEPFGEHLTTPCCETSSSELYDVVQVHLKNRSGISVKAMKDMWSQRSEQGSEQPPALPPKSRNRKLASATSCDSTTPPEVRAVPPLPRGGSALRSTLSGSLDGSSTQRGTVLYAQVDHDRGRARTQTPLTGCHSNGPRCLSRSQSKAEEATPGPATGTVYSELNMENYRSRSLPLLDDSTEEQHTHKLSAPSYTPPKLSPIPCKRTTCQTYSLLDPRDRCSQPASQIQPSGGLEKLCDNPLYQTSTGLRQGQDSGWGLQGRGWGPVDPSHPPVGAPPQDQCTYAQVPHEPQQSRFLTDNTYELIPDQGSRSVPHMPTVHSNTYEMIPDQGFRSVPNAHTAHSNTYELIPDQGRKDSPITNIAESNTYELIPHQGHKDSPISHAAESNTYELIPHQGLSNGPNSNTYETLQDLQPKHSESSWGIKVDRWRRFFPENKKK